MSIFLHQIKGFPFDKLYKAVQTKLDVEDEAFAGPLGHIKLKNEPAVKKLLARLLKENPSHNMEAFSESTHIFVRVLDQKGKVVDNTKTVLLADYPTKIQVSRQMVAEEKARHAAAARVVAVRQTKPIPVIHKNFAKEVMDKAGKNGKFEIKDLKIGIDITDPHILRLVPNQVSDSLLAQKLHDAASVEEIRTELTTAYINASNSIKSKPDTDKYKAEVAAAKKEFEAALPGVVARATHRASKPITDLVKMNIDQKHFKIEAEVALGVAVGGTVVGVAVTAVSIVTAPLHFGVATAASVAATVQSLKSTVDLIRDASRSLEGTKKALDDALVSIDAQYKKASSALVGATEMGKAAANALLPGVVTSINRVQTLVGQVRNGLENREIAMHRMAAQLSDVVDKAQKTENQLAEFEKRNNGALSQKQHESTHKVRKAVADASAAMKQIHKELTEGFAAVTKLKDSYGQIREAFEKIASGEPNWSKIGQVLIGTVVSAGFMAAGNFNSPDPIKGLEGINTIAGLLGNAQGSIDLGVNLGQGLEDSVTQ